MRWKTAVLATALIWSGVACSGSSNDDASDPETSTTTTAVVSGADIEACTTVDDDAEEATVELGSKLISGKVSILDVMSITDGYRTAAENAAALAEDSELRSLLLNLRSAMNNANKAANDLPDEVSDQAGYDLTLQRSFDQTVDAAQNEAVAVSDWCTRSGVEILLYTDGSD